MKKKLVLLITFLSACSLMSLNSDMKEVGEELCYGIIDAVSPGSNHVMDCLSLVERLINQGMNDEEQLIRAICQSSPTFPYSMGSMSEEQCLKSAIEEGYLPAI